LPEGALSAARDTLGGAVTVSGRVPGDVGSALLTAARDAFTHGMNVAAIGAAALMLASAVLSVAFLRGLRVEPVQSPDNESDNAEMVGSAF
jgi:DHA2 family multidrug resistance protein-like MFS transporter